MTRGYTEPMLDVIARSQRGRVCEYKRSDRSIVTPYVIKVDGGSNDPFHISLDDGKRVLHVMDTSVPLDEGLLTSESSDIYAEPVLMDGVCVIRLPFKGEIPEGERL